MPQDTKTDTPASQNLPNGLVGIETMRVEVFPDESTRPSLSTINRRIREGKIPHVKLGRLLLFHPPSVLEALIKSASRRGAR